MRLIAAIILILLLCPLLLGRPLYVLEEPATPSPPSGGCAVTR